MLGHLELGGDLPGGQRTQLNQAQDLPAVRVGERLEHRVGQGDLRCGGARRLLRRFRHVAEPSSSVGAGFLKVGGPLVVLGAERGAAVAVNVVDQARQILPPPRAAHVVALELLGESLVAEVQRGAALRGGAQYEVDVGAGPFRQRLGHGHQPPDVPRRLGRLHLE